MNKILCAWIGQTDLNSAKDQKNGIGPIAQAVKEIRFAKISLLSNWPPEAGKEYVDWLKSFTSAEIELNQVTLKNPTIYNDICRIVIPFLKKIDRKQNSLYFHLSPGTPAMAAVWIILAKSQFPAVLIQSSRESGVEIASIPFELTADFIPAIEDQPGIKRLAMGLPPLNPAFEQIIHRGQAMNRVVAQAEAVAIHDVPVLIIGESGTGKELFARAIHQAGKRSGKPFVAVNCGAIPEGLAESELFGYEKGAFTGAVKDRSGYIESADGGTLFLDEIGELPLSIQVKLLRVLQESEICRIGSATPRKVNIRVIAATNRNLIDEVNNGRFREDLFHRLAIGVLQIPPLRERETDLNLLTDHILEQVNNSFTANIPGWKHKNISASARNFMQQCRWPGNIRELSNTITRAVLWSNAEIIELEDIKSALLGTDAKAANVPDILGRRFDDKFNLDSVLEEVAKHYICNALNEAGGNKTMAAKKLGMSNYQTLTNWMKKYNLE